MLADKIVYLSVTVPSEKLSSGIFVTQIFYFRGFCARMRCEMCCSAKYSIDRLPPKKNTGIIFFDSLQN